MDIKIVGRPDGGCEAVPIIGRTVKDGRMFFGVIVDRRRIPVRGMNTYMNASGLRTDDGGTVWLVGDALPIGVRGTASANVLVGEGATDLFACLEAWNSTGAAPLRGWPEVSQVKPGTPRPKILEW